MATERAVIQALQLLSGAFRPPASHQEEDGPERAVAAYLIGLEGITDEELLEAVRRRLQKPDDPWWPSTSDLLHLVPGYTAAHKACDLLLEGNPTSAGRLLVERYGHPHELGRQAWQRYHRDLQRVLAALPDGDRFQLERVELPDGRSGIRRTFHPAARDRLRRLLPTPQGSQRDGPGGPGRGARGFLTVHERAALERANQDTDGGGS